MSEEVKELLEDLKKCGNRYTENQYYMLYKHDIENLIPYITNLQIDNEQMKEQLKDENNYHEEASKWYKEAFDTTQENIKLKKELEITTFNFQSLSSACGSLAEFMGLDKDSIIEEMIDKVVKDRKEKDLYKSVLKEIREYINKMEFDEYGVFYDNGKNLFVYEPNFKDKALEIIDKGLEEN